MLLMQTMAWEQYLADYFTLLTQFFVPTLSNIYPYFMPLYSCPLFTFSRTVCAFVQMIRILQVFCNILWN